MSVGGDILALFFKGPRVFWGGPVRVFGRFFGEKETERATSFPTKINSELTTEMSRWQKDTSLLDPASFWEVTPFLERNGRNAY